MSIVNSRLQMPWVKLSYHVPDLNNKYGYVFLVTDGKNRWVVEAKNNKIKFLSQIGNKFNKPSYTFDKIVELGINCWAPIGNVPLPEFEENNERA